MCSMHCRHKIFELLVFIPVVAQTAFAQISSSSPERNLSSRHHVSEKSGIGDSLVLAALARKNISLDLLQKFRPSQPAKRSTFATADNRFTVVPIVLPGVVLSALDWGDYDNDGDLDLLLTGRTIDGQNISRIYNNAEGDFVDSGAEIVALSDGAAKWGDYNNDNALDILMTGWDGVRYVTRIYKNENGRFVDSGIRLADVGQGDVSWVDYDNDGDLDILLTGYSETLGRIAQLYQNTNGTFNEVPVPFAGVNESAAAWGDFDNDGDFDLILSGFDENLRTGRTRFYRNDRASFVEIDLRLLHTFNGSFPIADFDLDGDLDLFFGGYNYLSNENYAYRNNNLRFTDGQPIPESWGGAARWADFDNDGDFDLIITGVTLQGAWTQLFRNTANRFTPLSTFLPHLSLSNIAAGDYDNDGDLDLVISGYNGQTFITRIFANITIEANTPPDPPGGLRSRSLSDIIILQWDPASDRETPATGLTYNLRIGTTPGGSEIVSPLADPELGFRKVVALGNVNHNTRWDIRDLPIGEYYWSVQAIDNAYAGSVFAPEQTFIITATNQPPFVSSPIPDITLKVGEGTFIRDLEAEPRVFTDPEAFTLTYAAVVDTPAFAAVRIDGTLLTVSPVSPGTATITVIAIDTLGASAELRFAAEILPADTSLFSVLPLTIGPFFEGTGAWGDYDNDGDLDIIMTGSRSLTSMAHTTTILRNDSAEVPYGVSFSDLNLNLPGLLRGTIGWSDYNNDNRLDFLITGTVDSMTASARLFTNLPGRFEENRQANLAGVMDGTAVWADYDNDGALDLFISGFVPVNSAISRIYRNAGNGLFMDIQAVIVQALNSAAVWGDLDNDGDQDLILSGTNNVTGSFTKVYRNDNGEFIEAVTKLAELGSGVLSLFDFDNDGNLDLLFSGTTASNYPTTKLYRNEEMNFIEIETPFSDTSGVGIAWGDYNNDGAADLVFAGRIYRNDGGTFVDIGMTLPPGLPSWGDYDGDGDLDLLIVGRDTSKVIRNNIETPNRLPSAPANLSVSSDSGLTTFAWDPAFDAETPQPGLTYNLRVGTSRGGTEIVSPMADVVSGRRFIPERGNVDHNTRWTIRNLPEGTYYWSVQAIDAGYLASPFAEEQTFSVVNRAGEHITGMEASGILKFKLYQNHPNPLNPETVISYQLAGTSDVELTIYDRLGREIRTLVRERQPAGAYEVQWDGRDVTGRPVASGLYLYRLQAGSFVQVRKLLVLK